ncbi:MAG: DUF4878 domain-containing protein [Betaproteobacteria bacterium]|nr:DUF4878 domain-containing protein [Betaproteobacteria bacterium]
MPRFFTVSIRKLITLFGTFSIFALPVACSSHTPETPESVVSNHVKAVVANRVDEAIEYLVQRDANEKKKLQAHVEGLHQQVQDNGGVDSILTSLVSKNDDDTRAKVELELKYKNGETDGGQMDLIKESGKWKIQLR